jgi:signal transduction histidine kinase
MLSLCITTVGFTLFSIYFLGLKQKFPHLANIILKFGILLLILTPMYYYIDFIYIKILYMIVLFILSIFVFYAGYRVYLKGYEIGLYFMISTGIGSIFISFFMLLYFPNFLPTNIWSLTLVNQALIWDVITLSLALAYYIKLLQEENTKNERLAMIKSKEITIGELNGNIAHQWRTPLAELGAIQANIEARLQYSTISREELLEQIQLGKNVIQYLSQTIETFQSFFQSRATNEIFSINDEIKRTIAFIGESLKNNGIELEFIEKVEDTVIKGNSNEFSQIILNIILNAKDTLVGQEQEKKNIKVELYQNNSVYKIIISDNGGGIKMKPIESIFDCYTTNKDNGNGIGLFIVKMIVKEKFGGKINVHNNKFGAVFEIDLQKIF